MYVNQATVCVLESFILRANICTFIAAKLSQIALFTYICSLWAAVKKVITFRYFVALKEGLLYKKFH